MLSNKYEYRQKILMPYAQENTLPIFAEEIRGHSPLGGPCAVHCNVRTSKTEQPWRRLVKVSVISNGSHAEIIMNKWAYFDVVLVWLWTGNNRSSYDDTMKHPTTCSWTSGPSCKVSKNQVLQKGSMPFSPGAKGCPFGWLSWFGEARCELATTTLQMMLYSCSQLLLQENKTYSNIYIHAKM